MKRIALLIAAFLGVDGAVYGTAIAIAKACAHMRWPWMYIVFLPPLILVATIQLGRRIAAIGRGGPWRMLPDGDLMFARALFVLVLVIAVLFGALSSWADHRYRMPPAAHMIQIYLSLSFIAQVLLLSRGSRLSKTIYVVVCFLFVLLASFSGFILTRPTRIQTWLLLMVPFTAGWLWAMFRTPRYSSHGARSAWGSDALENLLVRLRGALLALRSPAHNILQMERRGLAKLSWTLLLVVVWAVFMALSFSVMPQPIGYHVVMSASLWTVASTTFYTAAGLTPRARLLWLRCANSRAQLFRVCEVSALRRLVLISFVAWATVTGLALRRGIAIDAFEALRMLVACSASGVAALYAGLLLPTLAGWRFYAMITVVAVTITLIPTSWTIVLGSEPDYPLFIRLVNFSVSTLVCVALRAFAVWRWREIDWTRLRPAPQRVARGAA